MKELSTVNKDYILLNNSKVHTLISWWIKFLCLRDILRVIDKGSLFWYDFYISYNQKQLFLSENIAWRNQKMNFISEKGFKRLINLYTWNHKNKLLKEEQEKYKKLWLEFPKLLLN